MISVERFADKFRLLDLFFSRYPVKVAANEDVAVIRRFDFDRRGISRLFMLQFSNHHGTARAFFHISHFVIPPFLVEITAKI